jgi:hypothetical protein
MIHEPIEGLDEALSRVRQTYAELDTFGTVYAVLHSKYQENDLNCILEAARRYRDMCKAVDLRQLNRELHEHVFKSAINYKGKGGVNVVDCITQYLVITGRLNTASPVTPEMAREALRSFEKARKGNAIKLDHSIYNFVDAVEHHLPTIQQLLKERAGV